MALKSVFASVEQEVKRKLSNSLGGSSLVEEELLKAAHSRFTPEEITRIRQTIEYTKMLQSNDATHPSLRVYLSHPMRVALFALVMQERAVLDTVLIALLHNVYEVAGLKESDLFAQGYSEPIAHSIRLLTIDRKRESDPIYLTQFYGKIETAGPNLALIRCVDKLDNLLELELLKDDRIRHSYIDLAEQFVAPMAERLSLEFGHYFREVIAYMRTTNFQPTLRDQYDRFIAAQMEPARS